MPQESPEVSKETQEHYVGQLLYDKGGVPFKTKKAALAFIESEKLDRATFIPHQLLDDQETPVGWTVKKVAPPEKFFWVMFNAKQHPTDTNDVELAVEGEVIVCQREKPICLPEKFLECARHTRYPHYEQLPDKPRKITAWIQTYPFQILKDGSQEEFETMLSQGTRKLRSDIKRFGFDVQPDQAAEG